MTESTEVLSRAVEDLLRRAVEENSDLAELVKIVLPAEPTVVVGVSVSYETN